MTLLIKTDCQLHAPLSINSQTKSGPDLGYNRTSRGLVGFKPFLSNTIVFITSYVFLPLNLHSATVWHYVSLYDNSTVLISSPSRSLPLLTVFTSCYYRGLLWSRASNRQRLLHWLNQCHLQRWSYVSMLRWLCLPFQFAHWENILSGWWTLGKATELFG